MIGIFGGTFNPIHLGHLKMASLAAERLALDAVEFVPSHQSVHRDQPNVSAEHRAHMVQLAIADTPHFKLNRIELERAGASYMVDTLRQLKKPQQVLCLLLGTDAFNQLQAWRRPQEILELCHIVVCQRPDQSLDRAIFASHQTDQPNQLSQSDSGKILRLAMQTNRCSSSAVRQQLSTDQATECLPQTVLEFARQQGLYLNKPQTESA